MTNYDKYIDSVPMAAILNNIGEKFDICPISLIIGELPTVRHEECDCMYDIKYCPMCLSTWCDAEVEEE